MFFINEREKFWQKCSNNKLLKKEVKDMTKYLQIPDTVYNSMKIPDKDKNKVLLKELALALYKKGILSFGKSRELAKLNKKEFDNLLKEREIERHYNNNNLKEDVKYGKENSFPEAPRTIIWEEGNDVESVEDIKRESDEDKE